MIDEICKAFSCPPDVAERQNPQLVRALLDARNARVGIDLFNQGKPGYEQLTRMTDVVHLLLEIARAQGGQPQSLADVLTAPEEAEDKLGVE